MWAFFLSHAPKDYGFWGVLWCVLMAGVAVEGAENLESWEAGVQEN